jgi:hypothetical protein
LGGGWIRWWIGLIFKFNKLLNFLAY